MLVLTRKVNERITIDTGTALCDPITITVVRATDGSVRLGFEAEDDVRILRTELLEKVQGPKSKVPSMTEAAA